MKIIMNQERLQNILHFLKEQARAAGEIMRKHYGGDKPGLTPGVLLLTGRFGPNTLLETYIVSVRIMLKELLRA